MMNHPCRLQLLTLSLLLLFLSIVMVSHAAVTKTTSTSDNAVILMKPKTTRAPFVICRSCHNEILDMGIPGFFATEDDPIAQWMEATMALERANHRVSMVINVWEPLQMVLGSLRNVMSSGIRQALAEDMLLV
jgi:hypothetical protein